MRVKYKVQYVGYRVKLINQLVQKQGYVYFENKIIINIGYVQIFNI